MTTITKEGRIGSSGKGMDGLLGAMRSLAKPLSEDVPRMLAALARIGH